MLTEPGRIRRMKKLALSLTATAIIVAEVAVKKHKDISVMLLGTTQSSFLKSKARQTACLSEQKDNRSKSIMQRQICANCHNSVRRLVANCMISSGDMWKQGITSEKLVITRYLFASSSY